jgi:hypothetical protein
MTPKKIFALAACGLLLLASCNGGEIPVDTAKLEAPVNMDSISVVRQDPQQAAASDALGRIGVPAVPDLSLALSDPDPAVRMDACRALAYMGAKAKDAVPPLTQTLNDPEQSVRTEAAHALGAIGEPANPAIPELMQMLRGKK